MEDYRTIRGTATGEYEEKKSRFIAQLSFADSEEKAVAFLEQVRAANRTARHNVYAYRLREGNRERYSDDGEPAKTAGTPALEVLQQYATVDCGPDFASIVRLVCESYGLNERQLASRSHKQQYVLARNTIYYLARKHTDMSLKEIGERFNRRHSTVIKGITSLEREIANESRVGRQISRAVELIERNAGIRPEMSLAGKVPAARHTAPSLLSL